MYFKKGKAAKEQAQAEANTESVNDQGPSRLQEHVRKRRISKKESSLEQVGVVVSSGDPKVHVLSIRLRGLCCCSVIHSENVDT